MRLRDLHPKLEGTLSRGVLRFDCPLGHGHKFRVPLGVDGWKATGSFPDTLTVTPSIDANVIDPKEPTTKPLCSWHGFVTKGSVA